MCIKTLTTCLIGCLLPVSDADEEPEVHGDVVDVGVLLLLLLQLEIIHFPRLSSHTR